MNGDSERLTDVSSLEKGIEPEEKFFSNGDYKANYKAMSEFMGDALKRLHESRSLFLPNSKIAQFVA